MGFPPEAPGRAAPSPPSPPSPSSSSGRLLPVGPRVLGALLGVDAPVRGDGHRQLVRRRLGRGVGELAARAGLSRVAACGAGRAVLRGLLAARTGRLLLDLVLRRHRRRLLVVELAEPGDRLLLHRVVALGEEAGVLGRLGVLRRRHVHHLPGQPLRRRGLGRLGGRGWRGLLRLRGLARRGLPGRGGGRRGLAPVGDLPIGRPAVLREGRHGDRAGPLGRQAPSAWSSRSRPARGRARSRPGTGRRRRGAAIRSRTWGAGGAGWGRGDSSPEGRFYNRRSGGRAPGCTGNLAC